MKSNQQLLQINRNFLICFVVSASLSAIIAQLLSDYENHLNTTITIVCGYVIYFGIFSVLFYWDNKNRYNQMNVNLIKKELVSLVSSFGIGGIRISWSKMAYILLFSRDRNRAILSLADLRDYFNGILYGNCNSLLEGNKDILKELKSA